MQIVKYLCGQGGKGKLLVLHDQDRLGMIREGWFVSTAQRSVS